MAFQSAASDLVAGDGNSNDDVFTRTPATSATLIAASGGNGDSRNPSISSDGNEVAFTSTSTNLQADDTDPGEDVYGRQFSPLVLRLVSRADTATGAKGNLPSSQPSINDAGSLIAFSSAANNLNGPGGDTNATADVYLRSGVFAASPSTSIVSRPLTAIPAVESDGHSTSPSLSRNTSNSASLIAFETTADNMGADDENDFTQVYGRLSGLVVGPNPAIYISRPTGADPFRSGVNASYLRAPQRSNENVASMSQDGRFTVFLSEEDDLSAEDDDRFFNVYRRDNLTGETLLVSRADGAAGSAANGTSAVAGAAGSNAPSGAPAISADGNRIAFASAATNLVADDSNGLPDVFVRDVAGGSTVLASRQANGAVIPGFPSGDPALSGDGNRVAFVTRFAGDALDGNNDPDVYVRDLAAATTQLVSRKGPAGPAGNDASSEPAIDANGSHIAFTTSADDFSAIPDLNADSDIWVRDVAGGQVALVSRAASGSATGNDGSFAPAISADGNRIAFASVATNVVGGVDVNGGVRDVFLRDMGTATTSLVSATAGANGISGNGGSERPSIDAAGTRVAFETAATDLVPGDANGQLDVLLRDTGTLTTELVSRGAGPDGAQAPVGSGTASISGNGDCVAFETRADTFVAMPVGTDHARVLARALRGDCPFGPLGRAGRASRESRHDGTRPLARQHRAAPLPRGQEGEAAHADPPSDRRKAPIHPVRGGERDDPDRRPAAGTAAEGALRPAASRAARTRMHTRDPPRRADSRWQPGSESSGHHRAPARQTTAAGALPGDAQSQGPGGQRFGPAPRDVQDSAPALMARPVSLEARVSMSKPGRGMVIQHLDGSVPDLPDWVSLEIQVEFELDDSRRVSAPEPLYGMGGPLDCTRAEFEERVRDALFSNQPDPAPAHPRMDPLDEGPLLVATLRRHGGVESTLEALSDLPFTISIDDDVAQRFQPS